MRISPFGTSPPRHAAYGHSRTIVVIVVALVLGFSTPRRTFDWGEMLLGQEANPPADKQAVPAQDESVSAESEPPDEVLAQIQSALRDLAVPDIHALGRSLGTGDLKGKPTSDSSTHSLTNVGDLDGDGIPEMVLKWMSLEPSGDGSQASKRAGRSWGLFLLCWDGAHWRASRLAGEAETLSFQDIRLGKPVKRGIAVVTAAGETAVPYPVVFQVKDHAASLLWDGQAEDSRYEGIELGRVEFVDANGDGQTEMIVTGRAEPGLLVFAKGGRRGFDVKTTYRWDGQGYVPVKTQYSSNPDYTLYRFVSALHLHDFRAAYGLIDPVKFLKSDSPKLDMFRQFIEDSWPEFLDDQVFEAPEVSPASSDEYAVILPQADKKYIYHPTFSGDGKPLLTGLERREEK